MKVRYDFHIHSCLSPCADNDMTPANIVGFAALNGLDMIAVSDHNAIGNVKTAMKVGDAYGVTVVPAFELQTLEDVHILCLFEDYDSLESFYRSITFRDIKNDPDIFGQQLIVDEDDEVTGTEERLLLTAAEIYCAEVAEKIKKYNGVAVPAHIDREANGMLAVLGSVMPEFDVVEFSLLADPLLKKKYEERYRTITDSDAHSLSQISVSSSMELPGKSAPELLKFLRGE